MGSRASSLKESEACSVTSHHTLSHCTGTPRHTPGALTSGASSFDRFSPPGPRPSLTWIVTAASPPQSVLTRPWESCQNSSPIASLLQSKKSRGSQSHNHDLQNPSGNAPAPPLPSSTPTTRVQTAQYRDAKNQRPNGIPGSLKTQAR